MRAYLQYWEESERGWGVRQDGCSLHIDIESHLEYVEMIYRDRKFSDYIPDEYDRIVSEPVEVELSEKLYDKLSKRSSLRLSEVETNNLINMNEISCVVKKSLD